MQSSFSLYRKVCNLSNFCNQTLKGKPVTFHGVSLQAVLDYAGYSSYRSYSFLQRVTSIKDITFYRVACRVVLTMICVVIRLHQALVTPVTLHGGNQ